MNSVARIKYLYVMNFVASRLLSDAFELRFGERINCIFRFALHSNAGCVTFFSEG